MSGLRQPFDVMRVREDFPILTRQIHGHPLVYLDNAASAQKPLAVLNAMRDFASTSYANVHRGLHTLANEATAAFEDAREVVRAFLNAASVDEIVFTRSATGAFNLVAQSFRRMGLKAGDEIILSIAEHHSNIVPWHMLREELGIHLKWLEVDAQGQIQVEALEALLSERTRLITLTHMSNVLGTITPIADVVRMAQSRGVPVLVDGSQGAVHLEVDVQALGVDFYVCTGHKLYGPTGIGVLYGKRAWLEKMPPFEGGGEMIETVSREGVTYAAPPMRFEAGTPPIIEAVGLAAALRYMNAVGGNAIRAQENALRDYVIQRLSVLSSLTIFGNAPDKGAIFSFAHREAHAHDIAMVLDRYGIAVRAGTHCAQPLMQHLGVHSTCRASFAFYNTLEDVDRLVEGLEKADRLFA
jgi:cysteine desulfurase / selenocysteine lyase